MSKRRRGHNQTHYQVPSLQSLSLAAARRTQHGYSAASHQPRSFLVRMADSDMSGSRSTGTQTRTSGVKEGAEQVGQGLQVTIPRNVPHLYNNNYTVRLTYADNYRHAVNYGNSATQVWKVNSIFDPDHTSTGHQPIMRDLWASQYDYYAVLECEYEIVLYNGATDTVTYTAVGTQAQRVNSVQIHTLPSTNINDYVTNAACFPIAEMKNVTTYFLEPEGKVTIRGKLTPGDFIVDAKDADSDTTWTAQASNPAIPRYFGYVVTATNYASLTGQNVTPFAGIQSFAKLHYTVQFTQVAPSLRETSS